MQKKFHMTKEGIAEIEAEMEALINDRSAVAQRIKTAREFGDLSENAEYAAARQEQERAESRISEIENILKNAEIIERPKDKNVVELGNTVSLEGKNGKKEFTIVGSVEADPADGKISDESPIGQALLGKKVGEEVEIKTPAETTTFKVTAIR